MKRTNKLVAIAMAGLMASTAITPVFAWSDVATTTAAYTTQNEMLKTADEALEAVIKVHSARLALFENDTASATKLVNEGIDALNASEDDLDQLLIADTGMTGGDAMYLPFDTSMALTEGFTVTEENKLALQKAAGLFESADPEQAVDVLRLAEIDVSIQTAMLPAGATMQHLKEAAKLIADAKFFEANLALKAVEDGIIVRTFGIDAIRQQGAVKTSG